jgi:transposase
LRFLEEHLQELDKEIVAKIEALGYTPQWQLLQTVPGIKENGAASVLVEVGPDMGQFGSEKNLSSWAGVCPGNSRSAGKNKGSRTTKGNRWLPGHADRMCLGGFRQKELFSEAEVLAVGDLKTT